MFQFSSQQQDKGSKYQNIFNSPSSSSSSSSSLAQSREGFPCSSPAGGSLSGTSPPCVKDLTAPHHALRCCTPSREKRGRKRRKDKPPSSSSRFFFLFGSFHSWSPASLSALLHVHGVDGCCWMERLMTEGLYRLWSWGSLYPHTWCVSSSLCPIMELREEKPLFSAGPCRGGSRGRHGVAAATRTKWILPPLFLGWSVYRCAFCMIDWAPMNSGNFYWYL